MKISNKRDILKWFNDIRAGDGRRWSARIQLQQSSFNPSAAPLDPNSEHLDPSTDTVVIGAGIFGLTGDAADPELFNSVIKRKGQLDVHPQYEETFRSAYSVEIGAEPGSFEVVGVSTGVNKVTCRVMLQSRQ
jgi:hypothetical protein